MSGAQYRTVSVREWAAGALVAAASLTTASAQSSGGLADALPPVVYPPENPFTEQKRVLGKILFWDEQLSSDNTVSCATCHAPEFGGGDSRRIRHPGVDGVFLTPDDVFGSPGVIQSDDADNYQRHPSFAFNPQITSRAAQSAINAAYAPELFWDGRARGPFINPQTGAVSIAAGGALESQAVGPPLSGVEMAHTGRDWGQITAKLATASPLALATNLTPDTRAAVQVRRTYPALFAHAFGDAAITAERIAFAIATYERTLVADQTPWDAFIAGNTGAMTPQQAQGWQAFQASNCVACHTPPLFSDNTFRNIGLRPPGDDSGRQGVTGLPGDARRFKVPSVRNAALKSSFMHTGQFTALQQVIGFYANPGAQFPQNRDPVMQTVNVPPGAGLVIQAFISGGLVDPRVAGAQFPFDHPTLFTRRPNVNSVMIGAGIAGAGGLVPAWIANATPNVGNAGYKVGVRDALGGAAARLYISASPPVNNIVAPDQIVGPVTLAGAGPGNGFGTIHWPIPADPRLNGATRFVQWVIDDAAAPGGQSRTRPLTLTFFCGEAGCPISCPADCNADGFATIADFGCFQTRFVFGDPYADCDGDGRLAVNDFGCFQTKFAAGCP